MILVDTSVWVNHLRARDHALANLLEHRVVLTHPFVVGELALGHLRPRAQVLEDILNLPGAVVATDAEVLHFIERNRLFATGIGYVDAHLLAAVRLNAGTTLWTQDRRLNGVAERLGLAMERRYRVKP